MAFHYWDVEIEAFEKVLESGRTKPQICKYSGFLVERDLKSTIIRSDIVSQRFVVKACNTSEMTPLGRLCEFAAAMLAQALSIPVIEPAVIKYTDDIRPLLNTAQQKMIDN